jgi:alpha-L-rhamnosidase
MPKLGSSRELRLYVTIPANTTARVYIPAKDASSVMEGKKPAAQAQAVRFIAMEDNNALFDIGSGTYHFVSQLP